MSGYARFHRSLIGHPAFRNDAEAMAFAYMVLRASWKPARVRYKGRAISLNRGQLSISQRDMASALDRDKAWIERLWKRLRDEAMIAVVYEAGAAVITICNYDKYQASNDEREAPEEAPEEADARQTQGREQGREEFKEGNTPPTPPAGGRDRGSKIPEDWVPPVVADLSPQAKGCAEQWTDASYAAEAEAFRNYWLGESSSKARKSNWTTAWANRVVQIHGRVMKDQKFGNAPTGTPGPTVPMSDDDWNAMCDRCAERSDLMNKHEEAREWRAKKRLNGGRREGPGKPVPIGDLLPGLGVGAHH